MGKTSILMLLGALLGCGNSSPATVTIRVANIPSGTLSVNLDSQPYDACYLLPKRFAPAVAASLVLERRCFLGEPAYELAAWTYDAGCCIRSRGSARFDGETDPAARDIASSITVDLALAPILPDCRPALGCGPQ